MTVLPSCRYTTPGQDRPPVITGVAHAVAPTDRSIHEAHAAYVESKREGDAPGTHQAPLLDDRVAGGGRDRDRPTRPRRREPCGVPLRRLGDAGPARG